MSGSIQLAIYAGYGAAAAVLGAPCQQFRPNGPTNPLANQIGPLQAAFDTRPDFSFKYPSTYAKPLWYGLFDATTVQVGDYIASVPIGTFFVASLEALHPPMCVSCNETLTVLRPTAPGSNAVGALPPGGDDPAFEAPIMTGWPASVLQGTKGEKPDSGLVNDTRSAWMNILLPSLPGVMILTDDVLSDSLGRRLIVSSTELTNLGWRLTAAYAGA